MLRFERRSIPGLHAASSRPAVTDSGHHDLDSWRSADAESDATRASHADTQSEQSEYPRTFHADTNPASQGQGNTDAASC